MDLRDQELVIFDLDGVLTRTAAVHAAAWKEMFDRFLAELGQREGRSFEPFDAGSDYRRHVDGKPRYDGVRDFLKARGVELPDGDPDDPPERETVCGLGNRKNRFFLRRLEHDGVEVYRDAERLVDRLKRSGVRVAIASASRNCSAVLEAAGLRDLFEAELDGVQAAALGLAGKPAPDVFLEVARQLGVDPGRAAIVEDSLAGVAAGRRGGFGCVVGVDRGEQSAALRHAGADVVVRDLAELAPAALELDPPSALLHFEEIEAQLGGRLPALLLDYDGTLTEIVERPEDAVLAEDVRELLRELTGHCPVVIASGRDREAAEELIGVAELGYIGSHGFDIAGPAGTGIRREVASECLEALDAAERELRARLQSVAGSQVERKKFSVAVHFRRVRGEERRAEVRKAVEDILSRHPQLAKGLGHEVLELLPRVDWDKGRAVLWLLEALQLDPARFCPVYLGDDVTDEHAFEALRARGIGIVVKEESRPTAASYSLRDPREVAHWLHELLDSLRGAVH